MSKETTFVAQWAIDKGERQWKLNVRNVFIVEKNIIKKKDVTTQSIGVN